MSYLKELGALSRLQRIKSNKLLNISSEEFAASNLQIQNKDDEIVPFIYNRAQRHFINSIKEHYAAGRRFHLLIKARQLGFSTAIVGWLFEEICKRSIRGAIMAHDADTTAKLRRMVKIFYDFLPDGFPLERLRDNAAITSFLPHNSEITIGTAGGDRKTKAGAKKGGKGRGGTYNFFHGSEVAFWPNPELIIAGALQGLSKNGLCIFETTTNGAQGWVWKTVQKPGKWIIHFYPWWWGEDYTIDVISTIMEMA